jgi:GAF domain-containing protein
MEQAQIEGKPVLIPAGSTPEEVAKLAIPIKIRNNVIGVLQAVKPRGAPIWTADEQAMLAIITEQIGISLDSARLYHETQMRAETERIIGETSTRMRETLDIETVLRTAARELRAALNLAEVEIRMGNQPAKPGEE